MNLGLKKGIKGLKSVFYILFIGLILTVLFVLSVNAYVKASAKDKIITPDDVIESDVDCILVLGAGVWPNGKPSHMLEDRLLQGIELYSKGVSDRLLMSGDHGRKDYDEVNTMKEFAKEHGVPSEHIFMDHAGFSTYESIYRARNIFKVKKMVIVTQKYHLYRALFVADKLGIEAYGIASDPRVYANQNSRELREIIARVKDFFSIIFKPKPTYLGEQIPIDGDGNITND